jgi:phosphohistidine phosphatase
LNRLDIKPDAILTSPFPRAAETATILAAALDRSALVTPVEALGCGNSGERQIRGLLNPKWHEVMIVGHEPELMAIAHELAGFGTGLRFKKGSVCRIDLHHPEAIGDVVWLLAPRVLVALGA